MLVNVCPAGIFWTMETFVTKLACIIMSWSVMQKDLCANFKVKVILRACMVVYHHHPNMTVSTISAEHLQPHLVWWHIIISLVRKLGLLFQGHSEDLKCIWMFVWMMSSELLSLSLPNLLWQDSQPQTIFRSSLAKCKGTTVSNPLNRQPTPTATKFPRWTSALQSKVGQSEHQITSLCLHRNVFPWSFYHNTDKRWLMPQRGYYQKQTSHCITFFWFYFYQLSSLTRIQVLQK